MIIDLDGFIAEERGCWSRLEAMLARLENDPHHAMSLEEIHEFHALYQRTSADLARLMTHASAPNIRRYLENLVERAYGEIHETRRKPYRLRPVYWFTNILPRTFRRHLKAFWLAVAIMMAGAVFGGMAISFDPGSKSVLTPFPHLQGSPSERVRDEESARDDRLQGVKTSFSSRLMTHNTRVAIFTMAMGMTWGLGTLILLFYNGVILGAVALDYLLAGEGVFLAGWLLPHGSVEIPAIILAGQAGFVLAGALIGHGQPAAMKTRLRAVSPDLVTLILGVAILLVWAGIIEAFLSQYHEPVLPYGFKIGFGAVELSLLFWFLFRAGRKNNGFRTGKQLS